MRFRPRKPVLTALERRDRFRQTPATSRQGNSFNHKDAKTLRNQGFGSSSCLCVFVVSPNRGTSGTKPIYPHKMRQIYPRAALAYIMQCARR